MISKWSWCYLLCILLLTQGCVSIQKFAYNQNVDINSVRKIAVISQSEYFGSDVIKYKIGKWQTLLTAVGYRIVERGDIDLILKEWGLALSGLVDPTQAAKIGEVLGVEGIAKLELNSVNLIELKSGRVMWNVTWTSSKLCDRSIFRGQHITKHTLDTLRENLKKAGWVAFPKDGDELPFTEFGSVAFNQNKKHTSKLPIGVYPFKVWASYQFEDEETRRRWYQREANAFADKMSNALLEAGYDIFDRARLKDLMEEQKFSVSGIVSPKHMSELGKLTGIHALVFGTAIMCPPTSNWAVRLVDLETGELYWSAFGLSSFSTLSSYLQDQIKNCEE